MIADIVAKKRLNAFGTDPADQFEWYRWVTNDKLLVSVSTSGTFFGEEVRYTRLILVKLSDGSMTPLVRRSDVVEGDNVIHIAEDGSHVLVAIQKSIYDYPSVMRHELEPGGKAATPEVIANTIAFLAAPSTQFITGQTLKVNGGLSS